MSQHFKIIANTSNHGFPLGEIVTRDSQDDAYFTSVSTGESWFLGEGDCEPVEPCGAVDDDFNHCVSPAGKGHFGDHEAPEPEAPATPARPLIDFSTDSRETHRIYAKRLQSRVNSTESNAILGQIAQGGQVDAYKIMRVLPDIFSGCATRAAQSPGRREHTKMARALAHVANAVLSSHADGLPAYADGERSRKIQALEAEVEALKAAGAHHMGNSEAVERALTAAREEVENLTASVDALRVVRAAQREQVERLQAEVDSHQRTIGYAILQSTETVAAKIQGFRDAERLRR